MFLGDVNVGATTAIAVIELLSPVAQLASVVFSSWFIWKFRSARGHHRKRVFLQQLFFLAIVDLATSILLLLLICMHYISADAAKYQHIDSAVPDCFLDFACPLCKALISIFRWLRFASVLLETHIALGIFFAWNGLFYGVRIVQKSIPAMPIIGLVLGMLAMIFDGDGDTASGGSTQNCHAWDQDVVTLWTLQICFGISILCYLAAFGAAFLRRINSPGAVHAKVLSRTVIYALIFMVSYGPVIILSDREAGHYFVNSKVHNWFCVWAGIGQSLNGFLNTFTYYVQSHYRRSQQVITSPLGGPAQGRQCPSTVSFHVCFDPTGADTSLLIQSTTDFSSEPPIFDSAEFRSDTSSGLHSEEARDSTDSVRARVTAALHSAEGQTSSSSTRWAQHQLLKPNGEEGFCNASTIYSTPYIQEQASTGSTEAIGASPSTDAAVVFRDSPP